jgi:hypothetical protein
LSTAGLPKPTTPLKTEENENRLSENSTSLFSATKIPKGKHLFFYYAAPEASESMPCFYPFLFPWSPESRKQSEHNLLGFQKTFASLPPVDTFNRFHFTLYK